MKSIVACLVVLGACSSFGAELVGFAHVEFHKQGSIATVQFTSVAGDFLYDFLNLPVSKNTAVEKAKGKIGQNLTCQSKDDLSLPHLGPVPHRVCEFKFSLASGEFSEPQFLPMKDPTRYGPLTGEGTGGVVVRAGNHQNVPYRLLVFKGGLARRIGEEISKSPLAMKVKIGTNSLEDANGRPRAIQLGGVLCQTKFVRKRTRSGFSPIPVPSTNCFAAFDSQGGIVDVPVFDGAGNTFAQPINLDP